MAFCYAKRPSPKHLACPLRGDRRGEPSGTTLMVRTGVRRGEMSQLSCLGGVPGLYYFIFIKFSYKLHLGIQWFSLLMMRKKQLLGGVRWESFEKRHFFFCQKSGLFNLLFAFLDPFSPLSDTTDSQKTSRCLSETRVGSAPAHHWVVEWTAPTLLKPFRCSAGFAGFGSFENPLLRWIPGLAFSIEDLGRISVSNGFGMLSAWAMWKLLHYWDIGCTEACNCNGSIRWLSFP